MGELAPLLSSYNLHSADKMMKKPVYNKTIILNVLQSALNYLILKDIQFAEIRMIQFLTKTQYSTKNRNL